MSVMMRLSRALLLAIPALVLSAPLLAQSAGPGPRATQGTPRVVYDQQAIDFGKVDDVNYPTAKITFTNEGDGEFVIYEVKSSCSCTVGKLDKKNYAPGESGTLTIELKTAGREGKFGQTVTVISNDPAAPSRILSVRAEVFPIVKLSLKRLNFGTLDKGAGGEQTLVVTGPDDEFAVTAVRVDRPDAFAAEIIDSEIKEVDDKLNGGKKMATVTTVKVRALPTAPVGTQVRGTVRIVTNHEDRGVIQVTSTLAVRGDLRLEPGRLTLGVIRPGESFEKKIRIKTASGEPFQITGTVPVMPVGREMLAASEFTVEPAEDGEGYYLVMRGTAPEQPTPTRGYVLINTDVPGEPVVRATISGMIRKVQPGNLNR